MILQPPGATAAGKQPQYVLHQMTLLGDSRRAADGAVVSPSGPGRCFLHGPYWQLPAGRYRLRFQAQADKVAMPAQPVLGVEILAENRFAQVWRDYTQVELGMQSLDFEVPLPMALESGQVVRFEFKFFRLGNGALRVTTVILERLGDVTGADPHSIWRLTGRLTRNWFVRRRADGGIYVPRLAPKGVVLGWLWPYLRLTQGRYRLHVLAIAPEGAKPVVRALVIGRGLRGGRWRRLLRLDRAPRPPPETVAVCDFTANELSDGVLDFAVPEHLGMDSGEDAPFEFRLARLAHIPLTIAEVRLERLGPLSADDRSVVREPGSRPPRSRTRILVVGNCQAETVSRGFLRTRALRERYDVKYQFVQLQSLLHESGRRELQASDVVLAQAIADWDEYPLRDVIPAGVPVVRFPLLRLASPWPFDGYNGPGDSVAHAREWPNLTFGYLDGLLARLRREIPDPEARFRAYASLDIPGVVNYRRIHDFEARRLKAMDAEFECTIGQHVLAHIRRRPLFYTTNHPSGEVMAMLLNNIVRRIGGDAYGISAVDLDDLDFNQVPVHPKVAADLGLDWVTPDRRYLFLGEQVTWETYVRRYIAHYG